MADRFVPLTPRIGARAEVRRDEVLDPAFADECLDALEQLRRPGVPPDRSHGRRAGLFQQEPRQGHPAWGRCARMASQEVVFKVTLDPKQSASAEYLKGTIGWHIDGMTGEGPPPRATTLSARCLSPTGGQTEFCSTYAAYDDLAEGERRLCEPLRLVHSLEASKRSTDPNATPEDLARWRKQPQGE